MTALDLILFTFGISLYLIHRHDQVLRKRILRAYTAGTLPSRPAEAAQVPRTRARRDGGPVLAADRQSTHHRAYDVDQEKRPSHRIQNQEVTR
ncbi:hypothetical protein [Saccharopolyspora cebuensis]|uniref:Uncharacterized protein n=1 Tax=Saccharopolyspora cebuensis TaxID=418759 RepID=A0ABV4CHI5_9PSEU